MRGYWKCRAEAGPPLAQKNQGLGELPNPSYNSWNLTQENFDFQLVTLSHNLVLYQIPI
jgi:hypothetical protein